MNFFRKTTPDSAPVRRSSLTIREALGAARQAGRQTGDTGLFGMWLKSKGLSTRGNVLVSRMQREYEEGFEERFRGEEVAMKAGAVKAPTTNRPVANREGACAHRSPSDSPQALNLAFLERVKQQQKSPVAVPSGDQIAALYASGKASSLKEALVILGGGK